ncbi:unnamed protein product [Agarophyton chilense]
MNFGGGPNGNGPFQNPNFGAFAQSAQMPFTGQGPLADRPVQRGANGLYEAPEPEAPEQHPASQHIALNPGELSKYMEYWSQACDGADAISGTDAVPFLSRASNVSKGQLRKIWDIADHKKEGKLDQNQFFIALRLVALAQRGAALSEAGLRNFRGIQLIPQITPPPVKEKPAEQHPSSGPVAPNQNIGFSWTVPKQIVQRYDSFFHQLDDRKLGMIDGKQGVTFFGKSGLPRSTLKVIWQLADVTKDGKLSLDEFRAAMHMVANIHNRKLSVDALPSALDPSGPNWFRVEGEQQPHPMAANPHQVSQLTPNAVHSHASPTGHIPTIPKLSPTAHTVQIPGHRRQPSSSGSRTPGKVAPPSVAISPQPHLSNPASQQPLVPSPPPPPPPPPVQENAAANEQMLEALRKERQEVERAKREMEQMRAEMEKLRLEKEALSKKSSKQKTPNRTPSHSRKPSASSIPLPVQHSGYGASRKQGTAQTVPDLLSGSHGAAHVLRSPLKTPEKKPSSSSLKTPPAVHARNVAAVGQVSPMKSLNTPDRSKPIDLGLEDDDIWDQPSPKANALQGPSKLANKTNMISSKDDSVSSDDDDDDFWGDVGMGKKPTLGPSGGGGKGKGFGGSELDDWAF